MNVHALLLKNIDIRNTECVFVDLPLLHLNDYMVSYTL